MKRRTFLSIAYENQSPACWWRNLKVNLVDNFTRLSGSCPHFPRKLQSSNKLRRSSVPRIKTVCQTSPLHASEIFQPAKLFSRGISRKSGNVLSNHYADNCVFFNRASRPARCASFTQKHTRPAPLAEGSRWEEILADVSLSSDFCFTDRWWNSGCLQQIMHLSASRHTDGAACCETRRWIFILKLTDKQVERKSFINSWVSI